MNGSTPLKTYIICKHKSYSPQSFSKACSAFYGELASISALSNAKSIFSPGFSHVRKKYNVFSLSILKLSPQWFRCILNGKDHDADREGLGRETPTKIKMAGLERTGFVQTNLRRKKLIPERKWIIFFESQLRLLLAAQTIQTSTNKKKCWLKHQLCNTVTEL